MFYDRDYSGVMFLPDDGEILRKYGKEDIIKELESDKWTDSIFPPVVDKFSFLLFAHAHIDPFAFPVIYGNFQAILTGGTFRHYNRIAKAKRGKKVRVVYAADEQLHKYQYYINRSMLSHFPQSPYATAYKRGCGIKQNAAAHAGKPVVVKMDIYHFFDGIKEDSIRQLFQSYIGYRREVCEMLAALCCYRGHLPQGACTSPALANLYLMLFDREVGSYCENRGITYTRYSDDMTFSGENGIDVENLIFYVRCRLKVYGLKVNDKKTRILRKGAKHTVTGLTCNEVVNVSASYRRKIRQEFYYLDKYGVEEHLQRMNDPKFMLDGTPQIEKYLRNLHGRISFVMGIRPTEEFDYYLHYASQLLWDYCRR